MRMLHLKVAVWGLLLASLTCHPARADVFNMGGTRNADGSWNGLASLETVPVGNSGNMADTRYATPGYGGVSYTYNIGRYEVTAGQYCEFLNKVAGVDTYGLYNTRMWSTYYGCKIERFAGNGTTIPYQYRVASDYANRPVNFVSFWDSCRFTNWLHNGQPSGAQDNSTTENGAYTLMAQGMSSNTVTRNGGWHWAVASANEWYKAAYYDSATGSYYDYPTSNNSTPGRDVNDVSGNNANYYGNPYPIESSFYTTVVGEFQSSDGPYGTFDQGGNVWEWNDAVLSGSLRPVRGGSFHDVGDDLLASSRIYDDPTNEEHDIGFRVVRVPEPATLSLLALGGLLLAGRRRA